MQGRAIGDTARRFVLLVPLDRVEVDGVDGIGTEAGRSRDYVGVPGRRDVVMEADLEAAVELGDFARNIFARREMGVAAH